MHTAQVHAGDYGDNACVRMCVHAYVAYVRFAIAKAALCKLAIQVRSQNVA